MANGVRLYLAPVPFRGGKTRPDSTPHLLRHIRESRDKTLLRWFAFLEGSTPVSEYHLVFTEGYLVQEEETRPPTAPAARLDPHRRIETVENFLSELAMFFPSFPARYAALMIGIKSSMSSKAKKLILLMLPVPTSTRMCALR